MHDFYYLHLTPPFYSFKYLRMTVILLFLQNFNFLIIIINYNYCPFDVRFMSVGMCTCTYVYVIMWKEDEYISDCIEFLANSKIAPMYGF